MIRKIALKLMAVSALTPFAVIACNGTRGLVEYQAKSDRLYFLDPKLQDSPSKKHFSASNIYKDDLRKLPTNVPAHYHSNIMIGGYGSGRHFYAGSVSSHSKTISYHTGNDVLVKQGTKIYAPAQGDILSYWWGAPLNPEIAEGGGGELLMRVKVQDLKVASALKEWIYIKGSKYHKDWFAKVPKLFYANQEGRYIEPKNLATKTEYDNYLKTQKNNVKIQEASKYIYLYFMHLSRSSIKILTKNTKLFVDTKRLKSQIEYNTDIDVNHPHHVNQGELIGLVGNNLENGGWTPHVHIEAYVYNPESRINRTLFKRPYLMNDHTNIYSFASSKAMGTTSARDWDKNQSIYDYLRDHYYEVDTNLIYKLYDKNTPNVEISVG